jgi:hypothetical protein
MGLVVTGIAPADQIGALEAALTAAGFSLEHLTVIDAGDDARPGLPTSSLVSGGIGAIDTGTGVPGLTSSSSPTVLGGHRPFRDESLAERLGDLAIPDDELDNYLDAITAGRSVIAYFAQDDTIDAVERTFNDAGIAKVKRF